MTKPRAHIRKKLIRWHKTIGLVIGLPILFSVVTGVLLQFPQLFGPLEETTTAVAIDPRQPDHWLQGTNFGLHHSFDRGSTWQESPLMWSPGSIRKIVFSPRDSSLVYALGTNALLTSRDSGRIWEPVNLNLPAKNGWQDLVDFHLGPDGTMVLLTQAGLSKSQNNGLTWSVLDSPEKGNENQAQAIIHSLHTGHWMRTAGPWAITLIAAGVLVLVGSGFLLVILRKDQRRGAVGKAVALVIFMGLLLVSGAALAHETALPEPFLYEEARFLMGTLARIQVSAPTEPEAVLCAAAGFRALDQADSVFSTWKSDSEMSTINASAGQGPVPVSKTMARVLSAALDMSKRSEGAFDPTVLPLVKLWGFRNSQPGPAPSQQAIDGCLESVGSDLVIFHPTNQTVQFSHPETQLDFGGLAKGAALDQAAQAMMLQGAVGGLLDLGGGFLVFGQAQKQQVGVVNPLDPNHPLDSFPLSEGAVATSGQYERFRSDGKQTWGHILDPRTGKPCDQALSVTVVAESALLADALATACFVLGPRQGLALLENSPGCEGLVVFERPDGEMQIRATTRWPGFANRAPANQK
jgi:FAD:protein FMN transferase